MALTVTIKSTDVFGNKRVHIVEIGFDDSYPTGGEPLTARSLGMSAVDFALFEPSAGYTFEYDHTNEKIKAYRSASHAHDLVFKANAAANAVTMAANSLRNATGGDLTVVGGGADGGIAVIAQAALAEVTAAVDLLALTNVRGLIVGS